MADTNTEPVHVTIMGGTGDGDTRKQELRTAPGQPNIIATFVPTAQALVVRFIDTFLTVFVAISGIGAAASINAIKELIPVHQAFGGTFEEAGFYAFGAAVFGLLKDLTVIVGKLKAKFPLIDV